MKNMLLLKIGIVCIVVLLLGTVLVSCGSKKYHVDYNGEKSFYEGAKDEYREGQKVILYYTFVATDTDYTAYVEGADFKQGFDNDKYAITIEFTMPNHDVSVRMDSENSMVYMPVHDESVIALSHDSDSSFVDGQVSTIVSDFTGGYLTVSIKNDTDTDFQYGEDFKLFLDVNGEYEEVEPYLPISVDDILYVLSAGSETVLTYDLSYFYLMEGDYKLQITEDVSASFSLFEDTLEY